MAAEPARGCGYRKIGGLYLVGGGVGIPCDRLPLLLDVCPTCGAGFHRARGWTWVGVDKLVQGPHEIKLPYIVAGDWPSPNISCPETERCIFCGHPEQMGRAGLLWIGEQFYATPEEFLAEGRALGFSRRIKAVPRGFKLGETYVLLAHSKAIRTEEYDAEALAESEVGCPFITRWKPGVFYVWLPSRLELIFKESDRGSEKVADAEKRGITAIYFPDEDIDHQGSLWKENA